MRSMLLAGLATLCCPAPSHAVRVNVEAGKRPGVGLYHVGGTRGFWVPESDFDEDGGKPGGTAVLEMDMAMYIGETGLGNRLGVELHASGGWPLRSMFGSPDLRFGMLVTALDWERLRLAMGFGVGASLEHAYPYLRPRLALALIEDRVDLEFAWRWTPARASHDWDQDFATDEPGRGVNNQRLTLWTRLESGGWEEGGSAIRVFAERTDLSGALDSDGRTRPGTYWGGGVGVDF